MRILWLPWVLPSSFPIKCLIKNYTKSCPGCPGSSRHYLSFVREGQAWDAGLESGRSRNASIWRKIFRVSERSGGRPAFLSTPGHRTLEELVEAQAAPHELWLFMGNAWTDFFAKLGAKDVAVAEVAVSALKNEVLNCKLTFEFFVAGGSVD